MLINTILTLHVLLAISIVVLVLLQHGKGADMGAAFGTGSAGSLFGSSGAANFLSRSTAVCAGFFFVTSLGLTHLPAFVHLCQDTTVLAVAEGWDPHEWQRVAKAIGKELKWSHPEVSGHGDPAPTPGWPV